MLISVVATLTAIAATAALLAIAPSEAGTAFRRLTGINRPDRLLPPVETATGSDAYVVSNRLPNGDPVTFDPCKPIHYVVNPVDAPSDYRHFIDAAVREAEAASGLQFVFDGVSDDQWGSRSEGTKRRPVLFTFTRPEDLPELEGETVGLGGSLAWAPDGRAPRYVTGSIALDSEWFLTASAEDKTAEETVVVMHELGHVIGLGHVDDRRELMHGSNDGQLDYGPGDRAGLALLGAGPCD